MKLKIKFKSIKQGEIYLKTIQIEEETLVEIITSGIIPKLFKEEQRIEKKYNEILRIIGIEDMD